MKSTIYTLVNTCKLFSGILVFTMMLTAQIRAQNTLFELIDAKDSGIEFANTIEDSDESNILIYEQFYSGAGVAVGDLNNDGLPEIFFGGNQVPDKLYLNLGGMKFKDITDEAGILNKGGWSTGVTFVDINNDGLKDIYVCKSLYDDRPDLRSNELYINKGNMKFEEKAVGFKLNDPFRSMHATFFDYDKDGDFDIFLINQPPNPSLLSPLKGKHWLHPKLTYRFLRNDNLQFKEVTIESGLENVGYGLSSISADFNNDGWPDLYVANDYEGPDFLYINNQDGTFTNKIDEYMKHISFFSMGSDVADINQDGWLDLSVVDMVAEDNYRIKSNMSGMNPKQFWQIVELGGHYQYMYNVLQLNNGVDQTGQLRFSDIAHMAGASSTDWSWSPLFCDFDNNGYPDLFVTNGIKRDVRNTDALKKIDKYLAKLNEKDPEVDIMKDQVKLREAVSVETMLSYFPVHKLPNYMYMNRGGLQFEKVIDSWGLDQESFSNGAAYGDLDQDGDIDLVVSNVDDKAFIYENTADKNKENNYLNIYFADNKITKSFFGTRASIYYNGKKQVAELTSARGFYSSSEEMIHFGLGSQNKIDSLVIDWYDGGQSLLKKVKANQRLVIDRSREKQRSSVSEKANKAVFEDVTERNGLDHTYEENDFDDYEREVLLPHRMSVLGPCLAVADINNDGLEDFFVGGAVGASGALYVQEKNGSFRHAETSFSGYAYQEDMGALFFDADLDGDQDLYIASGSNEYNPGNGLYQDRLYLNDGQGVFALVENVLPELKASGGRVREYDYDGDGDLDLFVAGRQVPGHYPEPAESYLLKNQIKESGTLTFEKVDVAGFKELGMVTDASWVDTDGDGDKDLVVVGEWMPLTLYKNNNGELIRQTSPSLEPSTGWWYSLKAADLDGDGDMDLVAGNLGLNYKYKASGQEPFTVNYGDFDGNGKNDIVLGYYNYGEHFPLRGRSCSSQQVPSLKEEFPTYNTFASASLVDVYGADLLSKSLEYKAQTFASTAFINDGKGKFSRKELPQLAQVSNINALLIKDLSGDGIPDLTIAGNMYGSEIETTRNDAGVGLYLKGRGDGSFSAIPSAESNLSLPYDVKEMVDIHIGGQDHLLVGVNDGRLRLIKLP